MQSQYTEVLSADNQEGEELPEAETVKDKEKTNLLILAGNTISQYLYDLLREIYIEDDTEAEIHVVCGEDRELYRSLMEKIGYIDTIHIYGTPMNLPEMMDDADLLLTESRSFIISEAAKRRLPLVIADRNSSTLETAGCAVSGEGSPEIAANCIRLLARESDRRKMRNAWYSKGAGLNAQET